MAENFEWNYQAAGDLMLRSQEIASVCEAEAARMTRATGMAYKSDVRRGRNRVRAMAVDKMKHEDGQYRKRKKNGVVTLVYTQNQTKKG